MMQGMDTSPEDISVYRTKIDEIDIALVRLLNERAAAAKAIGAIKNTIGQKVYDPARESDVLDKINNLNHGPLSKGAIEDVFRSIIDVCRQIQISD